jgi:DNA-binding response OmpR family regulator
VLLPEMDGIELHRRLCTRWPGLRVLLMSGFPGGNARIEEAIGRGDHFLQKPFGPVELLEKVREAASVGAPIT